MKNRNHHILMALITLFLGVAVLAQGMPMKTALCAEIPCCCCEITTVPLAEPVHFSGPRTVTCKGREDCCRIQEKRASHEVAMTTTPEFPQRPTISWIDTRVDARFMGSSGPSITLSSNLKWPPGTAMPIFYQTLSILC